VFLGTYEPRLDEKGRLILPAKYRDELAAGLVLTRGQERCLYVFPMAEFERIAQQLRSAPVNSKQSRDYLRLFLSGATDEVPDKQGRVTIPPGCAATPIWAATSSSSAPDTASRSGTPKPGTTTSPSRRSPSRRLRRR